MKIIFPTRLSRKGAQFIGRFEGLVLHPYNDAVGNATIGYGHLLHYGYVTAADTAKWRGFTAKDAAKLLIKDAALAAFAVAQVRPRIKNQARFDALVSLAFNCGPGVIGRGHSMGDALRAPGRKGAADAFLAYDHAGGQVLEGLRIRREAERNLFVTGRYS